MNFRKRSGTKLNMKCHQCRQACATKDGDWHNGVDNQVFLCRSCEISVLTARKPARPKPLLLNVTA